MYNSHQIHYTLIIKSLKQKKDIKSSVSLERINAIDSNLCLLKIEDSENKNFALNNKHKHLRNQYNLRENYTIINLII